MAIHAALRRTLLALAAFPPLSVIAGVAPPTLTYVPTYDPDGISDVASEVFFPAAMPGTTITATVTPTATGGAASASTAMACSVSADFTITGGGNQVFDAPGTGSGAAIQLSTISTSNSRTGVLTCIETDTPGGATRTRIWDLVTPFVDAFVAEFESKPSSGGTLPMSGAVGGSIAAAVAVSNTGLADLTVNCSLVGDPAISLGAVTSPLVPGGQGSINVNCVGPAPAGSTAAATVTCATNDLDEPQAQYNVACTSLTGPEGTPPTLSYSPTFDVDGVSDAVAEVFFPAALPGTPVSATVTPMAAGGANSGSTAIVCSVSADFTIVSGGAQNFVPPGGTGAPILIGTVAPPGMRVGLLTCIETDTPGGAVRTRIWDLIATHADPLPSELAVDPVNGSTLTITGAPGTTGVDAVQLVVSGFLPVSVQCNVSGNAAISLGTVTNPVVSGMPGAINVSCAVPATAGSVSATLTCATSALPPLSTLTYTVTCASQNVAIPTLSRGMLVLLALLLASIGGASVLVLRRS